MKKYEFFLIFSLFIFFTSAWSKSNDEMTPPDYLLKNGVCPVSNLKASNFPAELVCQRSADGKWIVFVGMRNFLDFVHFPEKYLGRPIKHSGDILVLDHSSKKSVWVNALFAYFVIGDQIVGADGKRQVFGFKDEKEAEVFSRKNGGLGVFRFLELKRSVVKYLNHLEIDSTDLETIIVPKVIETKTPK